jgi:proline iminopeptidase
MLVAAVPSIGSDDKGQTFETSGATIYFEVIGSKGATPLILVNGGPGFSHNYLHKSVVWEALAKNRQVVFYDQRGTGRSLGDHRGQTFTLKDQIDDLEALRAHLGYEHIDLLGHSWGGFLGMAYAALYPYRVSSLTLVDSMSPKGFKDSIFLFDDVFPEVTERQASVAFAAEMGDKTAVSTDTSEYLSMLFYSPEKRDAFLADFAPSAFNRDVNRAVAGGLEQFDLSPEIHKFQFPVLIVTGRYDMNVAPLIAYRIHHAVPNSKFAVFEHSGHLPFYEEPEAFQNVFEKFLAAT